MKKQLKRMAKWGYDYWTYTLVILFMAIIISLYLIMPKTKENNKVSYTPDTISEVNHTAQTDTVWDTVVVKDTVLSREIITVKEPVYIVDTIFVTKTDTVKTKEFVREPKKRDCGAAWIDISAINHCGHMVLYISADSPQTLGYYCFTCGNKFNIARTTFSRPDQAIEAK